MNQCILLSLLAFVTVVSCTSYLKVGSFNIQIFGSQKMSNKDVVKVLKYTLRRYDVALIMEIRDSSEMEIINLLNEVNSRLWESNRYDMVISKRDGRSSSKEQYAYFYKKSKVTLIGNYTPADGMDKYERAPFLVHFKSNVDTTVKDFFFVGLHSKPTDTPRELDELVNVYKGGVKNFGTENAILMGDLNADCSYFNEGDKLKSILRNDVTFKWINPDSTDTTTKNSHCAYDRFIAAGPIKDTLEKFGVFDYKKAFALTQEMTEQVSDHFPIEVEIH